MVVFLIVDVFSVMSARINAVVLKADYQEVVLDLNDLTKQQAA